MSSPIVAPLNAHAASGCSAAAHWARQDAPGEALRHSVRAIAADRSPDGCSLSAKPVYGTDNRGDRCGIGRSAWHEKATHDLIERATADEASPVRFARTIPGGRVVR